jgi:hypothetical protein
VQRAAVAVQRDQQIEQLALATHEELDLNRRASCEHNAEHGRRPRDTRRTRSPHQARPGGHRAARRRHDPGRARRPGLPRAGVFYDLIASYPPDNAHFLKDIGSWQFALGAAALYAARRPAWRVPMLGILAIQYTLHTISHLIDLDVADPAWQGTFALVTQGIGAVVLVALFLRERAR